jgi:hypothetical protein
MAYARNAYQDQQVFINGTELKGVQSFDGSWSIPNANMIAAGYEFVGSEIEGELVGEVSVSRNIITGEDPITGLMGDSISGYLLYGPHQTKNKSFNFNNGYITSYSSSCSIGEVASSNFSLTAYGDIGTGNITDTTYDEIDPVIATANSMTLNTSFGSTNAVQSYSFDLSLETKPIYKMGDMFVPSKFEVSTPISVSTSFEIVANEYEVKNLIDSICSNDFVENISFSLNEKCNSNPIRSFTLNNAKLVNSSITAGIGNNLSISLGFENQFSSIEELVDDVF